MKIKTKYRYVVWHKSGNCTSVPNSNVHPKDVSWHFNHNLSHLNRKIEKHLNGCCPGEWNERVYDTEDENDRLLIEALMTL